MVAIGVAECPSLPGTDGFPSGRDLWSRAKWMIGHPSGKKDGDGLEEWSWKGSPVPFLCGVSFIASLDYCGFHYKVQLPYWKANGGTGRSDGQPLNQSQAPNETTIARKEAEMLD